MLTELDTKGRQSLFQTLLFRMSFKAVNKLNSITLQHEKYKVCKIWSGGISLERLTWHSMLYYG